MHYFSDDLINIKHFDPIKIKKDENSYKMFYLPYWIREDQRPKVDNNYSANLLYLTINKMNG